MIPFCLRSHIRWQGIFVKGIPKRMVIESLGNGMKFFELKKNITVILPEFMKIKIFFVCVFVFVAGTLSVAQGFQRRTVEERTKRVVDTLTSVFKFDKTIQDQAFVVFTDYYKAMDKLREGLPQGERPERTEVEKLSADRDEKLKKVLTEDQFKKFKDEIEPALRPRRRQG